MRRPRVTVRRARVATAVMLVLTIGMTVYTIAIGLIWNLLVMYAIAFVAFWMLPRLAVGIIRAHDWVRPAVCDAPKPDDWDEISPFLPENNLFLRMRPRQIRVWRWQD